MTRLIISKLPSGTVIDVPVHVLRAVEPGPTVLLMAGMHGDEVNGIETIRRLIRRDLLRPSRGTIIAIPLLNIYGFLNFSREVPDGKDVNRSFPGNPRGSLASRVAHRFMREIMPLVDYGIDFHTGGASRSNHPQVRCLLDHAPSATLAEVFAAPFTLHAKLRKGSLREAAFNLGKPIIVYETGESLRLDEAGIEVALAGTFRVLHYLGMLGEAPAAALPGIICWRGRWLRARFAGLFRSHVQKGQHVAQGQVYGVITDPYGEMAVRLESPVSGYVVGLNHMPVVNQGDALLHIGLPEPAGTEATAASATRPAAGPPASEPTEDAGAPAEPGRE